MLVLSKDLTNMQNIQHKTMVKDTIRAARVLRTAKIVGVSPRHVRRVCEGVCQNMDVIDTMVRLAQAEDMIDSLLIQEVKKTVAL